MVWWVETKKSNSRKDKNFNFSKFSRQDISRICQTNSRQDKTLIGWKFQDKTSQDSRSCQEIIKTSRQEISRPTPGTGHNGLPWNQNSRQRILTSYSSLDRLLRADQRLLNRFCIKN